MLIKPPTQVTSCFKYVWRENASEIFVVFRENAVGATETALWRNKDVWLNVEQLHARTWAFAFPIAQLGFCSLFRGSLVTQNVFIEIEKS